MFCVCGAFIKSSVFLLSGFAKWKGYGVPLRAKWRKADELLFDGKRTAVGQNLSMLTFSALTEDFKLLFLDTPEGNKTVYI